MYWGALGMLACTRKGVFHSVYVDCFVGVAGATARNGMATYTSYLADASPSYSFSSVPLSYARVIVSASSQEARGNP